MTKKIDRKDTILDAMMGLVVKRGFHDAPMSELAKKSGASPGVIYHYFPSKDELIHAVYQRVAAIRHEECFRGYSERMNAREALLHIWLNTYDFYRTHKKEVRFLDQYLNSGYCKAAADEAETADPVMKRIVKWLRPKKHGGMLRDLPPEAIDSLTLGLATSLARAPKKFSRETLTEIAETVWKAIAVE